ncbi:MAG: alpha/beta fold hydrolase [Bacteroidia bacterium]|nr:alpha/beta fold hydrolase [Bacteroidia bacterium]
MKLHHREVGEGTPVLILHGLFGSSDNWMSIGRKLGEQYKVYMPDLRNHGKSPWSNDWNYDFMAQDVLEFVQTHAIHQPIIIGHSLGGKVAMLFTARYYAEETQKLIVVDIAPKAYPVHHDQILEALISINLDQVESRQEADEQLARYLPDKSVRQFLLKNLNRDQENRYSWQINLEVIKEKIGIVGEPFPEDLSWDKPTLFIRGRLSNYIKDQDIDLIKKHFPQSQLSTLENTGHWIHAEKPAEFLEITQNFLTA